MKEETLWGAGIPLVSHSQNRLSTTISSIATSGPKARLFCLGPVFLGLERECQIFQRSFVATLLQKREQFETAPPTIKPNQSLDDSTPNSLSFRHKVLFDMFKTRADLR